MAQQTTALPIVAEPALGDKVTRAHVVVLTWEAGRIFAREGSIFLPDFLAELHAFPKGSHDDQVDAFAQGVRYLLQRPASQDVMDYYATLSASNGATQSAVPQPTRFRFVADRREARAASSI